MTVANHPIYDEKRDVVTPDDDADLPRGVCRALWVGGAGIVVVMVLGSSAPVTIVTDEDDQVLTVRVVRVLATGTTATSIAPIY